MRETAKMQVVRQRNTHKSNVLPKTSQAIKNQKGHKQVRKASSKVDGNKKRVATTKSIESRDLGMSLLWPKYDYIHTNPRSYKTKGIQPTVKIRAGQSGAFMQNMQLPKGQSKLRKVRKWPLRDSVKPATSPSKKLSVKPSITASVQEIISVLVLATGSFGFYHDHVKYNILTYFAGLLAIWLLVDKILRVK